MIPFITVMAQLLYEVVKLAVDDHEARLAALAKLKGTTNDVPVAKN